MALAMIIFGSTGLIRRQIEMDSGLLAFCRGGIGFCFIILVVILTRRSLSWQTVKENLPMLILSGLVMSANWISYLEAFKYNTIAFEDLLYHITPCLVMLSSAAIFKEPLGWRKIVCIGIAFIGIALVSGGIGQDDLDIEMKGVFYIAIAILTYAAIVILNKKTPDVPANEKTVTQLFVVTIVLGVYAVIRIGNGVALPDFTPSSVFFILVIGAVHTGLVYLLFFAAMKDLDVQTIAVYAYIDPVTAVFLSTVILREPMSPIQIAGAVIFLSAAVASELQPGKSLSQ